MGAAKIRGLWLRSKAGDATAQAALEALSEKYHRHGSVTVNALRRGGDRRFHDPLIWSDSRLNLWCAKLPLLLLAALQELPDLSGYPRAKGAPSQSDIDGVAFWRVVAEASADRTKWTGLYLAGLGLLEEYAARHQGEEHPCADRLTWIAEHTTRAHLPAHDHTATDALNARRDASIRELRPECLGAAEDPGDLSEALRAWTVALAYIAWSHGHDMAAYPRTQSGPEGDLYSPANVRMAGALIQHALDGDADDWRHLWWLIRRALASYKLQRGEHHGCLSPLTYLHRRLMGAQTTEEAA